MADNNAELDIINHLLEVEKNAAVLIDNAKQEAETKKNQATATFNAEYKRRYDELMAKVTSDYEASLQSIKENHQKELEDYKASLTEKTINKNTFNEVLDKLFSAGA